MTKSLSIRLQPNTVSSIEKIANKRYTENGVKDSKTRIIAEAVSKLEKEEFDL